MSRSVTEKTHSRSRALLMCPLCVVQADAVFDRMSAATGVHITNPEEALERISSQHPREQHLRAEIEALETAIAASKQRSADLQVPRACNRLPRRVLTP